MSKPSKSKNSFRFLRNGIGRRISRLGEKLKLDFLVYNPLVMRQFHDDGVYNAPIIIPAILRLFPESQSFLDVGSATGLFAHELIRNNRNVIALERSSYARSIARKNGVDSRSFDLLQFPPAIVSEEIDLVYCFEVAEHMPPVVGDKLVEYITSFNCATVFSAAHIGQGGTGHINEQPTTYWIERFQKHSFTINGELTELLQNSFKAGSASSWYWQNTIVFFPENKKHFSTLSLKK